MKMRAFKRRLDHVLSLKHWLQYKAVTGKLFMRGGRRRA